MALSDQLIKKKAQKHRAMVLKQVKQTFRQETFFAGFVNKPTAEQIADMATAAKYGPGDPLSRAGMPFCLEYIFDEYNRIRREDLPKVISPDFDPHSDEQIFLNLFTSQVETWANLSFAFSVDETLYPYLDVLRLDDYEDDDERNIMVHKESRAFGIAVMVETMVATDDLFDIMGGPLGFRRPPVIPHPFKAEDKWTHYHAMIAPLERLCDILLEEDRDTYGVTGHQRHLRSGKVVPVRAHNRLSPRHLAARKRNRDEVCHLVYAAYDSEGRLRYIGEGKAGRPGHVNSGCSHNFKLNEHFFLRGAMKIEIIKDGLSKQEGLAIEKLLLQRHLGDNLWNRKDYEPLMVVNEEFVEA